jgi:hypothetical protein
MKSNAVFFAWNRSLPGRESLSADHFQEFVAYLNELEDDALISDWVPVFLEPHGGDMNGCFLIQGDPDQLDDLVGSEAWITHMTRAQLHLEGSGAVRAAAGETAVERMKLWTSHIPD